MTPELSDETASDRTPAKRDASLRIEPGPLRLPSGSSIRPASGNGRRASEPAAALPPPSVPPPKGIVIRPRPRPAPSSAATAVRSAVVPAQWETRPLAAPGPYSVDDPATYPDATPTGSRFGPVLHADVANPDEMFDATADDDANSTTSAGLDPIAPLGLADFGHGDVPQDSPVARLPPETPPIEIPADFEPWWLNYLQQPTLPGAAAVPVSVDGLVTSALAHSPFIRIAQQEPLIRQTIIRDEVAQFDWKAFLDTRYDDFSDPVGNVLTTGGAPRFRDNHWIGTAGLKQKNDYGGEFRGGQQFGYQDNNSIYFVPTQQGATRFELNYLQPLLNRAGQSYNRSRIVLAQIDAAAADDESHTQIQNQLLKITENYWLLYRARAAYLQKVRLLNGASGILETLEARSGVDVVQRQVLRARAAVAARRTLMARADTEIRNAESQLRLLVKDPQLLQSAGGEMIPQEPPLLHHVGYSLEALRQEALQNRPDFALAMKKVQAASVRLNVSKNELLPRLDLLLMTYVAGLEGRGDLPGSYNNQFSEGEPGYTVGLTFEVPLGNRAAKARRDRRELELGKVMTEFEATVDTGLTDVELAYREMETAFAEMVSEAQAVQAAQSEESYLYERWRLVPGDDRSTTLLLEDLLSAQERVAFAEDRFVTAQARYVTAIAYVKRATGTLFRVSWSPTDVVVPDGASPANSAPLAPMPAAAWERSPPH